MSSVGILWGLELGLKEFCKEDFSFSNELWCFFKQNRSMTNVNVCYFEFQEFLRTATFKPWENVKKNRDEYLNFHILAFHFEATEDSSKKLSD